MKPREVQTMKCFIFILLMGLNGALCLKGSVNSICYISIRMKQVIEVGPKEYQTMYDIVPTEQCCSSYYLKNDECLPTCHPSCKNGLCTEPNVCACSPKYTGPLCESLICPIGYEGPNCDQKCSQNRYGQNCQKNCSCEHGDCDPITGYCYCHEGWSGLDCSVKCPESLYCLNAGVCDFEGKYCACPVGYTGQNCEKMCEQGFWGNNCTQSCDCGDNYICNPVDGECKYNCGNGEYYDGSCWCNRGWTGEFCTEKLCPTGFYGENCNKTCSCKTTRMCDRYTGRCDCKPGWIGDGCREPCPAMTYGEKCNKSCECIEDRHDGCDPISGICMCKSGWTGVTCDKICTCVNGQCDSYGNCICSKGWQSKNCEEKCDDGYYGEGCSDVCALCSERGHFACDHIRGPICAPGFTGSHCTDPCPEGTFGTDCQNCTCETYFMCNRFTGECECRPGWYGSKCDIPCPSGLYGYKCDKSCKCPNCRATDGYCACQAGWNSPLCQGYCPEEYFDLALNECIETKTTVNAKSLKTYIIIFVVVAAVIALATVISYVLYKRNLRRGSKTKWGDTAGIRLTPLE